jgi:hypothetical protein
MSARENPTNQNVNHSILTFTFMTIKYSVRLPSLRCTPYPTAQFHFLSVKTRFYSWLQLFLYFIFHRSARGHWSFSNFCPHSYCAEVPIRGSWSASLHNRRLAQLHQFSVDYHTGRDIFASLGIRMTVDVSICQFFVSSRR